MYRPTVKNFVRLGLFVTAIATVACSNPTAPDTPVNVKKAALRDSSSAFQECRSGYVLIQGVPVCQDES